MLVPLRNLNLSVGPLFTAMSPSHRAHFAEYRRWGYMSNGWDPPFRWNGYTAAMESVGIKPPEREAATWTQAPAAGGGLTTLGIHRVRYRWQDSRTGS